MGSMKIGIFTETYEPTVNGVVVSINTFRDTLERAGHEYFIFAPASPHQKKKESHIFRFPSFHFHHDPIYPLAMPMPFVWAQKHLPLDIIKRLDIIHIQHFSMMGQYGLSAAAMFQIPTVYTYHTMAELYTAHLPFGSLIAPPVRAWSRYTAKRAKNVIVPTPSIKDYLYTIGVRQPINVIPTGIKTHEYSRTPAAYVEHYYHVPTNRQLLLFVGRLAAEKNVDFLLKAYEQVRLAAPETHLLIVGDGPDRSRYEQMVAKRGLSRHVTFTGFLDRPETIKLFGAADLFVFPSITDTQGIVVLEAMAAGTVPVAIDRFGPHDIIDDGRTGALTDLNIEDFSGTISNLLHEPEKMQRMAAAARLTSKKYDVTVTAKAMETLYARITHQRRS